MGCENSKVVSPEKPAPVVLALCLNGCGKESYNGNQGEYCSFRCRFIHLGLPRPLCIRPGCSRHAIDWNPHWFCGKTCRDSDYGSCIRPGCNQKAVKTFCSRSCEVYAKDRSICVRLGCNRPLPAGQLGCFCTLDCQRGLRPAPPQTCLRCGQRLVTVGTVCGHHWCNNGHIHVQRTLKDEELRNHQGGYMLSGHVDSDLYLRLESQFRDRWDSEHFGAPRVKAIFHVDNHAGYQRHMDLARSLVTEDPDLRPYGHGHAEMPGNMKLRYHGTLLACDFQGTPCDSPICSVCKIIKNGFDGSKIGTGHGRRYYGDGIYCSSSSATAYKFSRNGRAVLAVSVVCGRMLVRTAANAAQAMPGGHHVMVVQNPDDSMGTPVMQGATPKLDKKVDELVVFRPEAIHAKYLFILEDPNPGGKKCANHPRCFNKPDSDPHTGRAFAHCSRKCAKLSSELRRQFT